MRDISIFMFDLPITRFWTIVYTIFWSITIIHKIVFTACYRMRRLNKYFKPHFTSQNIVGNISVIDCPEDFNMTKTVHAIPCSWSNREVNLHPSLRFIYVSFQMETKHRIEMMVADFHLPLSFSEKWYLYLCVQENVHSTQEFRDIKKRNSFVLPF